MENISATTMTPLALTDERGLRDDDSVDLYVHEAAHQWFGDLLTCDDWSHSWLNEGFASYSECLWAEHTEGYGAFRCLVRQYQESHIDHALDDLQPTVSSLYREPGDLFDADIYDGACVRIDQLRFLVGDELFRRAVHEYVREFEGENVVTQDFQGVFERVSGQPLDWFFEQWFLRPGFPQIDLQWRWDAERGIVELRVAQVQQRLRGVPGVFRAEVDVEVRDATGVAIHRVTMDERTEVFELPAGGKPDYVRFDAGSWLPKSVRWHKSTREWIALAELCDDPTARVDAARALGNIGASMRRDVQGQDGLQAALWRLLDRDPQPWVRGVAAEALGKIGGSNARAWLMEAAAEDAEVGVREAALGALTGWGESQDLAAFADAVYTEGSSYGVMGAAALLRATSDPAGAFDWIAARLEQPSPHDILRQRLLTTLAWVDDERVRQIAWRWAADRGSSAEARSAAVQRLGESQIRSLEIARFLGELLEEPSYRLRSACLDALAELDNPEARRILRAFYKQTPDGGQRRVIEAALRRTW
jgi:aminopeptidase N